jgi:NAD(P)-dependent dehydrogenase (short-subunit alcohol dehydrogenase family)
MRVLIIGASRGIGLEFVKQYTAAGAHVTGTARSAQGLDAIKALGAKSLTLDLADDAAVASLARHLEGESFDIVIHNAGAYGPRTAGFEAPSPSDFDHVMQTNVLGPMRVLPQVMNHLAPDAKVAVLSSRMGSMGLRTNAQGSLYRASKAAVNSVLKDLSIVLQGKATCVAFHPGWVRTDMGGPGADLSVEQSVGDMRKTLATLHAKDNGSFLNHDGQPLAW